MIVMGAFLAEAAATVDNRLHVWGGVLTRLSVGLDRRFQVVLVLLTQRDTGSADLIVRLEISPPIDAEEEQEELVFEVPRITAESEIGFAFWPIGVKAVVDGRYAFVVKSGETAISLPLVVLSNE